MHLFGALELEQELRPPEVEVGCRRLKIAGQDAFELFNLLSMEKHPPQSLFAHPTLNNSYPTPYPPPLLLRHRSFSLSSLPFFFFLPSIHPRLTLSPVKTTNLIRV